LIYLDFNGIRFRVDHPDVIGFYVFKDETDLGIGCWDLGLMLRDGSKARRPNWTTYGVEIEHRGWHEKKWVPYYA
jgi:hypothetical protein